MALDFGFVEVLDLMSDYTNLPTVSEIPEKSPSLYYEKAEALKKYCTPDFLGDPEAKSYPKFIDWCNYISRFRTCAIAPHPSEFSRTVANTTAPPSVSSATESLIAENDSNAAGCYDDYFCEGPSNGGLLFIVYGVVFSLLCSAGLLLNLACIVGFNRATNRSGATLYFSVIAVLDCVYSGIILIIRASVHLSDVSYAGQEKAYAERAAYFVPGAVPLLVWLVVCLLVERYLYLHRGYFSKSVTSLQRHVRIVYVVTFLAFCYIIPRFFELKSEKNPKIPGGYRVICTEFGTLKVYRSLVDYLLNVPLEMFLPYLAVGLLTSLAVSKMVDLGSSKWKTVASLCSQSAYCCCGDDFANCYPMVRPERKRSVDQVDVIPMDYVDAIPSPPRLSAFEETCGTQIYYCGIPFEKRSDLMPFYFLVPPPRQNLKETANVVITVCLGFLLLITKIPKLILVALELERYVDMNPAFTRMASECLNIAFIVLKPPIYLILGVHFRHALTGLCCCACLYAPVISKGNHEVQNEEGGDDGDGDRGGGFNELSKTSPDWQGEDFTTEPEKGGSVSK
ncbi:unnamed protein product [Hydatigera taeniaeformis]|uniref:G_PROTEIN_RECEP_F1_2 domain-containing protein n=1 Tax=Hydatigena taeniaeformis TaxID=6205 RepID=A0A0R3WJU4_HYDTA|nr:unnamed protein product [Hydatigera taeniaeformis]